MSSVWSLILLPVIKENTGIICFPLPSDKGHLKTLPEFITDFSALPRSKEEERSPFVLMNINADFLLT